MRANIILPSVAVLFAFLWDMAMSALYEHYSIHTTWLDEPLSLASGLLGLKVLFGAKGEMSW